MHEDWELCTRKKDLETDETRKMTVFSPYSTSIVLVQGSRVSETRQEVLSEKGDTDVASGQQVTQ